MTKSMYLGVIAGIIIVGGLFWWFGMQKTGESTTDAYSTEQMGSSATNGSTSSSTSGTNTSSTNPTTVNPNATVTLKTTKGDIVIQMNGTAAPIAVANFVKLAESGFYNGVKFHRVIKGFMIQGGDPLTKDDTMKPRWGTGGPGYTITDEFQNGLTNDRGTIAMANTGQPNSSGSQFFINHVDNAFLNGGYTVFGKVTKGIEVVDAIANTPTGTNDVPTSSITITSVVVSQ